MSDLMKPHLRLSLAVKPTAYARDLESVRRGIDALACYASRSGEAAESGELWSIVDMLTEAQVRLRELSDKHREKES